MRLLRFAKLLLVLGLVAFAAVLLYGYGRSHPQDLPWTALDLSQPVGLFTGRKLAALGGDGPRCRALLARAGVDYAALPRRAQRSAGQQCGYQDGVRLRRGGALAIAYRPEGLGTSCPVAAALALWEWHVVQPAALARFGEEVASIDHLGSYSCRRIYGRAEGAMSEHAAANAVDVAGFRLAGGRRITIARDWRGSGGEAAFLRDVRDGACRLFATVLSPDYNQAHADHLHLDQARRGAIGWRGCR